MDVSTVDTQIPIIINNRDRLDSLLQLIDWLERAGQRNIHIVDNDSSYPPLIDYYRRCKYDVIRLSENIGHLAPWTQGIVERVAGDQYFVVTDPDIVPVAYCPMDAFAHFRDILDRFPERAKVGFGLKIDDLPTHYRFAEEVKAWEGQFWKTLIEPGLYDAPVDSTFALYRPGSTHNVSGLRTGEPYVARHTAWYVNTRRPNQEERYYRTHVRPDVNHWDGTELPDRLKTMMADAGLSTRQPQQQVKVSLFQRMVWRRSYKAPPVAILIPTYNRPENLRRVIDNIEAATTGIYTIYFVIESDDLSTQNYLAKAADPRVKVIINTGPRTYPGAINTSFLKTREPVFFCGADDLHFYPEWLPNALRLMGEGVSVVGTNDLHHPEVLAGRTATHFLVKRNYIERTGGVIGEKRTVLFNYNHNYCDTEFIETARARGVFQPCLSSVVEHLHWSFGKASMDSTYEKSWSTVHVDDRVFVERRQLWEQLV